jgi:hypothetical protein
MSDHDQRFKLLLQEFFAEFIHLFFPQWADRFDFAAAEWLNTEVFVDPPEGERRNLDVVVKLPLRPDAEPLQPGDSDGMVAVVHVEVEARDRAESLRGRMFNYYQQLRLRHKLPVLPVALFLRAGLDGVGWDSYEEWFWDQILVKFRYAYIGLPALNAFDYLNHPNILGVALSVLMKVSEDRRAELKAEAMERLATSSENAARRYLLCECVEAYLPLEGPQLAEFERLLITERYKEAQMLGVTSFERGLEQGQRTLLLRQIENRFGKLSAESRKRFDAVPAARLADLGDLLIAGADLTGLGLDASQPE